MAESVSEFKNTNFRLCGMLVVLALTMPAAYAENLPDPTRPSGTASANAADTSLPSGPVLQSVLHSSGRKVAIISGQTVRQGDMVGSARVTKIGDAEVVLTEGRDRQVLKLFPVLEKQPSKPSSASKYGARQ